jgi:hypothetical protein
MDMRKRYYASADDSGEAKRFYEAMKDTPDTASPLELGYKGMSAMLRASHAFSPLSKIGYFREGKALLESAILRDPESLELRFLRYTVQDNAPFFLGYRDELERDLELILERLPRERDADLAARIKKYLEERK